MKKKLFYLSIRIFVIFCFPVFLKGQYSKVDEIQIFGSRRKTPIVMDVKKSSDKVVFTAINESFFPYDFTLAFSVFQNLSPMIVEHKALLHTGYNRLFVLDIDDKTQNPQYQYSYQYSMASSKKPDLSFPYLIPIGAGKTVKLDKVKEDNKTTFFINQFMMDAKDTAYSIRKGIVTALPDNNTEVDRIIKSSSLEILHNDGTIAIYLGLDNSIAFLKLGQVIYPGQPVGIIGESNTLILQLLSIQEGLKLKNLEIYYAEQNDKIISSNLIEGTTVYYPPNIINKEMTSKEIKKAGK